MIVNRVRNGPKMLQVLENVSWINLKDAAGGIPLCGWGDCECNALGSENLSGTGE